jgi:hypothetical protein
LNINICLIIVTNQMFCVVQCENNERIFVVSQSSLLKSNHICFIEIEDQYQRGKIQYKGKSLFDLIRILKYVLHFLSGSQDQCEMKSFELIS